MPHPIHSSINQKVQCTKQEIPAVRPAVVALYETECKDRLYNQFGFTTHGLPGTQHLVLSVFDRKAAKNVWYEWMPEIMDLFL